jgi:exopolysaccharide biosynthesis polyprenyl glycosylphosphotransferase
MLIGASGLVLRRGLATASIVLTADCVLAIAALSAGLALAFRQLAAPRDCRRGDTACQEALGAGLTTMVASCAVVLFCAVVLPASARVGLGSWATSWITTGTLATGALHYAVVSASVRTGSATLRAIIVGDRARTSDLERAVLGMHGWHWLDCCCAESADQVATLINIAKRGLVDVIVLDSSSVTTARIGEICDELADIPVRICLGLDPESVGVAHQTSGLLLTNLAVSPLRPMQAALKRGTDILFSLVGLLLALPVLLVAIAAIRIETNGPALFRQLRSGRAGASFQALKLRTMYIDVCDISGEKQTSRDDPRVTRVGRILRRTSIDELPQLINVLRGDMSLVGPRAHPVHMKINGVDYSLVVKSYRIRHRMRPGLTGWAQVNGSRGGIDSTGGAQRRIELDLFYMRNWSILLDFEIILRTICGGFIAAE